MVVYTPGGGGGIAIYGLYGYVPLWREMVFKQFTLG